MSEMPGEPLPAEDARLLDELRAALGDDPAPPGFIARAEGLVAYAGVDRELAELLETAAAEPAGLRSRPDAAAQPLVFEVADGSISVELVIGRDRLDGQVHSGTLTEVVLERPGGDIRSSGIDELGRFAFTPVAAGPARLRLRSPGDPTRSVTTDWFLV
jgi:hypothetical protein